MNSKDTFPCSLKEFLLYFLKLGATGFGGPIALVGYMQRDLVEKYKWISKEDYLDGLALAQLAPGPLAAQLAMYLGYIRAGFLGATLVALAFILPSFLMVIAISWVYVRFGGSHLMQALFYGIGACVIGIIFRSAYKLLKMTLGSDVFLWIIFVVLMLTTAITETEIAILFFLSGFIYMLIKTSFFKSSNCSLISMLPLFGGQLVEKVEKSSCQMLPTYSQILLFFGKAGAMVFGSGLAIIPFLYGGVVKEYHWLTDKQFMDAVAIAMITPGPVLITVAFIGYLLRGFLGAVAAAVGVFLPVYLFVIIPSPWFKKYVKNPQLNAFVKGVIASATGAIAGACFVLSKRAIYDLPTAIIAILTLFILTRFKIPEPVLILFSGIAGLVFFVTT